MTHSPAIGIYTCRKRRSKVAVIAPRDEPSAFGSRMVLKPSMPFPKRLITRSDDGYFVQRPRFQRWVARSLDEGQVPAGAKEVDARLSAVREHPLDRRYRKPRPREASQIVVGVTWNRIVVGIRCAMVSTTGLVFRPYGTWVVRPQDPTAKAVG